MKTKRYCLALDLIDDQELIAEYEKHHRNVWPEVKKSILEAGIENMEIYRSGNQLMMIMEVSSDFSFGQKAAMDAENPTVQEWERLMWKYQKVIPTAKPGEKWVVMDRIFELNR